MAHINHLLIICLFCLCVVGCRSKAPASDLAYVMISTDAGPIPPESRWHETITLSRDGMALERKGFTDESTVNAGRWELMIEPKVMDPLFDQLQQYDCRRFKRIEPADAPDGGQTVTYTLAYKAGKPCELVFDPGVAYTESEPLLNTVKDFLQVHPFPPEAAVRY